MSVRPIHRRLPLAGLVLVVAASASACGGESATTSASPSTTADVRSELDQLADEAGAPEECRDAYPAELTAADLADVELLPPDWPEPPVDATLCRTSSTMDDSLSIAGYATTSSPTEVLDAYEAVLADSWEVVREDRGAGEVLTGTAGSTWFQVETRDGAFDLSFASA